MLIRSTPYLEVSRFETECGNLHFWKETSKAFHPGAADHPDAAALTLLPASSAEKGLLGKACFLS